MATLVELAELCDAVYGDASSRTIVLKQSKVVWNRAQRWSDGAFFAALYTKPGGNAVLAYRGTDDAVDALQDDTNIAVGQVPPSVNDALNVAGSLARGQIILTGHSLGGALSIIAAGRFGLPAVTFNAPGVMNSCVSANAFAAAKNDGLSGLIALVGRCFNGSRMKNIRVDGDAVSSPLTSLLSKSLQSGGAQSYAAAQCGLNLLCRHGIATCIAAVRSRTDGYQEVKL
jgi:fermentation-respiration switch protein FrsA (DUF1100 family)